MSEPIEALARVLGCDPFDSPTRPLSVDGVVVSGWVERRCRTHQRAMRQCETAKTAERILADPGPLLDALPDEALVEALVRRGVLVEEHVEEAPPPPPEPVECCASGRCEVCTPGYDWGWGR